MGIQACVGRDLEGAWKLTADRPAGVSTFSARAYLGAAGLTVGEGDGLDVAGFFCVHRSVREIGVYFDGVNRQAVSNLAGKMAHEREGDKNLNLRLSAIEKTLSQNG